MNHFPNETTPEERYKNDLLNETRRTNALLEAVIELLQTKKEPKKEVKPTRKPRGKKNE